MRRFCGVVDCTFSSPRQPPWGVSRPLWGSTPQLGLSGPKKRTSWHCPVNMVVLLFELVFLESLQFLDLHEDFQAFGSFSPLLLSFMYMGFSAWKDPEMMVSMVFKNHTKKLFTQWFSISNAINQTQFGQKLARATNPLGLSLD